MNWEAYDQIVTECRQLGVAKNADYGDASLTSFGVVGTTVRLIEKSERLRVLLNKGAAVDETVEDTLKDIINYAIYTIILGRKLLP